MSSMTAVRDGTKARLLVAADLQEAFGVTYPTLKNWERSGRIPPAIHVGRRLYWRRDQLSEFLGE